MINKVLLTLVFVSLILTSCQNGQKTDSGIKDSIATAPSKETGTCFDVITETPYDIPAQRFDETAQALTHASGCFIETDLSKTGAIIVKPIKGKMSIRDAVKIAIEGTELTMTHESSEKLQVEKK